MSGLNTMQLNLVDTIEMSVRRKGGVYNCALVVCKGSLAILAELNRRGIVHKERNQAGGRIAYMFAIKRN